MADTLKRVNHALVWVIMALIALSAVYYLVNPNVMAKFASRFVVESPAEIRIAKWDAKAENLQKINTNESSPSGAEVGYSFTVTNASDVPCNYTVTLTGEASALVTDNSEWVDIRDFTKTGSLAVNASQNLTVFFKTNDNSENACLADNALDEISIKVEMVQGGAA